MQLTKYGHACVRIESSDGALVIDPGGLTDPHALDDADAALITHEHFDHFSEGALREALGQNPRLQVWTNAAVAAELSGSGGRVHVVGDGDAFGVAGLDITVHGTWHAAIHPDMPRMINIGFLIDGTVFHPGDALTVPDTAVDTLLLPVHGPWSTTGQLIDYVRAVHPHQVIAVHDGALNDVGTTMVAGLLDASGPGTGSPYRRLAPGASTSIGSAG
ncbi:MBL fold metallo-hydrolase [Microlunatus soli]|uniref:L-ascorbate metabolism protein UlaG, beta-lactamase superfamily n=1 Tax=Microlunatus soli TaxID=630515 RepID=A0A1H1VPJ6_9ACTN|nr:MBL fold metallo-hydrolase [Microlunatus soli]SDS86341.1 L-ascorbate metabolism protein UlaG, beta-lactamase superfamily [Microlunatus soli]